jgi:hypothetical protein
VGRWCFPFQILRIKGWVQQTTNYIDKVETLTTEGRWMDIESFHPEKKAFLNFHLPQPYKGDKMKKLFLLALTIMIYVPFLNGCDTSANVASKNLSKAAEEFQIERRIVFVNGITDNYIMSIEGKCSVEFLPNKFEVTCKIGDEEFVKHYLGRADNVFPFVEQLQTANVSTYRYKVIFKPTTIVPDVDLK